MSEASNKAFRRGTLTFVALMILTAFEYFAAITLGASIIMLFLIALVKAALIVWVFMHVFRLWREESH